MAPERSCKVTFVNSTDLALTFDSIDMRWGIWSPSFLMPPNRIDPGSTTVWETVSDGVMTGTEVVMYYRIELAHGFFGGYVMFWWNIPFFGSNQYDQQAPSAWKWALTGDTNNPNADIRWELMDASTTGDGIPDNWKLNGFNSAGQFIDLPAMGADVNRPDIFIQLDWMADTIHDHIISAAALRTVVDAFDLSPYVSKNGSVGINLHIDHGPGSVMIYGRGGNPDVLWGTFSKARNLAEQQNLGTGNYDWSQFQGIKTQAGGFMSTGRASVFRYCISAHQLSVALITSGVDPSGFSRRVRTFEPASDLILALGDRVDATGAVVFQANDANMAGTLMHELGHCLGLNHGGGDDTLWKPNFLSVMNYHFQFVGLVRRGAAGIVDYSREALMTLQEDNLDENVGLGAAAAGLGTVVFRPSTGIFGPVVDGSLPIDWNEDSTFNNRVNFDILNTGAPTGPPPAGQLTGFEDWPAIRFLGGLVGLSGGPGAGVTLPATSPPGMETHGPVEIKAHRLPDDVTAPVTTALVTPAPNAAGWNNSNVAVTLAATDDISGVAKTEYSTNGGGTWSQYNGDIRVSTEGEAHITYRSTDHAGNVETAQHIVVKVDKTPPEVHIAYDPHHHKILVTGLDSLSGVPDPGSSTPLATNVIAWTRHGSDPGETRVFRITDAADNQLVVSISVRCEPDEYELSVIGLQYQREEKHERRPQRNTIFFRRLRGYQGQQRPLLHVHEQVSLGEGQRRESVRTAWDVLHDDTEIWRWKGGGCHCGDEHIERLPRKRGLWPLNVVSYRGSVMSERAA